MSRFDPRVLVLLPMIMLTPACGSDPEPPAPAAPSSAAPPSASAPSAPASADTPEPDDSVYVEEEPDPTTAPGDLSDEAQSYLDQALGIELGALASAPEATAAQHRETLDRLPENPSRVLAALKNYQWLSPEAKALYDRAAQASR
jgi:hypothetical protein